MAKLVFFDDGHRYEVDGHPLPSVSEILRFMSREVYGNIQQWTLDNAGGRGTRVHKACQAIATYGQAECDDDIAPYVTAYVEFLKARKPKWDLIEKAVFHAELGYAGTVDLGGVIDGERWLIDIKAQEQIKRPLVSAQVNGYRLMLPDYTRLGCLQLRKNGTYKLHEIPIDESVFAACLTLHKAMAPARKEKKTNE